MFREGLPEEIILLTTLRCSSEFIKLVSVWQQTSSPQAGGLLFEQELYKQFVYCRDCSYFHSFVGDVSSNFHLFSVWKRCQFFIHWFSQPSIQWGYCIPNNAIVCFSCFAEFHGWSELCWRDRGLLILPGSESQAEARKQERYIPQDVNVYTPGSQIKEVTFGTYIKLRCPDFRD